MSEQAALVYKPLGGDRHRHAGDVEHAHFHRGPHTHDEGHPHEHGHYGLVHDSIKRSREGVRAVSLSLAVLGVAAVAQTIVFIASGSIALLADLIHNFGDALTAVPLGIAFALRSQVAERRAGLAVVAAIFISACVVGVEAVQRLIRPAAPTHWRYLLSQAPSATRATSLLREFAPVRAGSSTARR